MYIYDIRLLVMKMYYLFHHFQYQYISSSYVPIPAMYKIHIKEME